MKMKKIFWFSSLILAIFSFGNLVFALNANITQINFTSSTQTINVNTLSASLSIQTQDATGTLQNNDETNHLNLNTTSTTGEFYNASGTTCTDIISPPVTLTMRSGSANKNFCYKDSTPGTYTLTVSAQGQTWTPATQNITIVGNPVTLSSIAITTPATKLNYTVGDSLDISGLIVTGTYSDNTTKTEAITTANISGFDSTTPTTGQVLTITDGTQTATYTVDINANGDGNPPTHLDIKTDVDVPTSCSATDTDGVTHDYPKGNSYLAICATETAIKNGSISNVKLSNQFPSMGLFITSINNVTADPNSQYWAIYQNGNLANFGITSLPVIMGDILKFQLNDFSDNNLGDQVTLNIHSLVSDAPTSGGRTIGSSGSRITTPTFDIQKALAYLKNVQNADGSFGSSDLYTDWAGIAFDAMSVNDNSKTSLLAYLNSHNALSSLLTDNERRAMTLLSLGQNPYSFNGVNYINAITSSFDGIQFGDANLINDDIFALIPLQNAGYTASDEIIIKDVAFLISKQKVDGSWEESVDITAATIQALKSFESITGVSSALSNASLYLQNSESSDGGWGNISSTSWAMQAMSALGASWSNSGHTPMDYLASQQATATDGAVSPSSDTLQNRIWTTSYAIAGASLKPWSTIMQMVLKPTIINTQTPTNLVICKKGDLFNAVTGHACATNTLISETKKPINKVLQDLPISTNTPAIIPDTLTATAVNTLPENTIPHDVIPFTLGVFSGVAILFLARKFFIK